MFDIELSAGTIEYEDTGSDGPVLVFIHGLLMDGTGWRHVVEQLRGTYRCILPTWPLGSHRIPMRPEADLTLVGMGHLIGEFLDALGLRDVTLIQNDWGRPGLPRRVESRTGLATGAHRVRGIRQLPARPGETAPATGQDSRRGAPAHGGARHEIRATRTRHLGMDEQTSGTRTCHGCLVPPGHRRPEHPA